MLSGPLQIGFCFKYQLVNLVWLFIDFFSFNSSQPHPQSNFKECKTSFSPSSYSEKMQWSQASLFTFLWLYFLVCVVVQKHHKMFF